MVIDLDFETATKIQKDNLQQKMKRKFSLCLNKT